MKKMNLLGAMMYVLLPVILLMSCQSGDQSTGHHEIENLPLDSVRAIAKDAYIYAFPVVESYRIQHAYFVDTTGPEFKFPYNRLKNIPKLYTAEDKAVQTPNSDTPYSFAGIDLRGEPQILAIPYMDSSRYFSIQVIDAYTHNIGYFGSRTTGTDQSVYLITGPNWDEEVPFGIKDVIRCETELAMVIIRTQLFGAEDLPEVEQLQKKYILRPLSQFTRSQRIIPSPISFIEPLNAEQVRSSIDVFKMLNFVLQFCPTHPSESELMARFAKIGIGAGQPFDTTAFSADVRTALRQGIADAWNVDYAALKKQIDEGVVASGDVFGTREFLNNNYLYRMVGAVLGIYGNSKEEAMYPIYTTDADGNMLNGEKNKYQLHFDAGQLPPVNAFWSLTMYELPSSLLVENPIDRYLLNSTMMDQFNRDADGGITFYLQNESPGKAKESNWLPAPKGPFMAVLRLYWPQEAALDGSWVQPSLKTVR